MLSALILFFCRESSLCDALLSIWMKKITLLILVSNMIDRDAAFSLKRLDGSGPFSGLTQLHANYFFLSNFFCGFLFDWVSRIWVLYFDLIFFYTRWNCEKARFALVGCDFFSLIRSLLYSLKLWKGSVWIGWMWVFYLIGITALHLITSPLNHSKREVFPRRKMWSATRSQDDHKPTQLF